MPFWLGLCDTRPTAAVETADVKSAAGALLAAAGALLAAAGALLAAAGALLVAAGVLLAALGSWLTLVTWLMAAGLLTFIPATDLPEK